MLHPNLQVPKFYLRVGTPKNPHQVRWAMFFLGKHRIYSSTKLIMDHIDYQYTKCPIIKEAYPALRALIDLSSPAADEAVIRMKTERDKLRLELLARVVIGVYTPGWGSELIRAAVASDPAQSKRVEAV